MTLDNDSKVQITPSEIWTTEPWSDTIFVDFSMPLDLIVQPCSQSTPLLGTSAIWWQRGEL